MSEQFLAPADALIAATGKIDAEARAAREFLHKAMYDEAFACCRRMEDLDLRDEAALNLLAEIVVAQSREHAGMPIDGRLLRRLKSRPPAASQPLLRSPSAGTTGGPPITVIQQLEASIRERPSIPELYLQLAQAYLDKDRDYDAERLLFKGREATDHDIRVQTMWEEVAMLRHARRVEMAQEELKANDNPQTQQALADATKDRDKAELDIFRARVKRQSADVAAFYGLGIRLQRAGRTRDACDYLEKALTDDNMRAPAALALAHGLAQLDDLPSALRHYRLAAESAIWTDQFACRNEALAEASKLARQMKLAKLAERYASGVTT